MVLEGNTEANFCGPGQPDPGYTWNSSEGDQSNMEGSQRESICSFGFGASS